MRTVDEHLAVVLGGAVRLPPLELQLLDAQGCVLAEDVHATADLPAFDNAAMDGYAVHAADLASAGPDSPVQLPVDADIPAGRPALLALQPGSSMRIMTGAPLPVGCDAVVEVESTDSGIARVAVRRSVAAGTNIRRAGEDVRRGDRVVEAGTRLGPGHLGLLAAIGRERLVCHPRPRVVVVSTGSELVEAGQDLAPGQIYESNGVALTAAAREAGAVAYRVGVVPDDPRALLDSIEDQLVRADLVVTTGGVSAGAYDVVKEVLSRLGTVEFAQVAMQPGRPQGYGTIGPDDTPIFTLPGNPVSAYVSFELFVRPVIRAMMGAEPLHRPQVRAVLAADVSASPGRRRYVRGVLGVEDGRYVVTPLVGQGSHQLAPLAAANALVVVPEDSPDLRAGDAATVLVLERRSA